VLVVGALIVLIPGLDLLGIIASSQALQGLLLPIVLGAVFTVYALRLQHEGSPARAMRLFSWSITYVTLLFGAMAADTLVRRFA